MNQWLNRSQPITLQAAVILGYLTAVFGLLGTSFPLGGYGALVLTSIALGVGAFATANNKRWGYALLALASAFTVLQHLIWFQRSLWDPVFMIYQFNRSIFALALLAAAIHVQSREYQKIWFE